MKAVFLAAAAALTFGGVAVAQTTGTQTDTTATQTDTTTTTTDTDQAEPSGQTVDDPSQSTGPEGITQQGTDPNGQAAAPAGTNQGTMGNTGSGMTAQPMAGQQAAFTPRPATQDYPACSRTVTDSCIQTYERGVRRARGRR